MNQSSAVQSRDPDADDPEPLARFRLDQCLACSYPLKGLPPDHVCPECGAPYSPRTLQLLGWSHVAHVPGTGLWWLHLVVYTLMWSAGLVLLGPLAALSGWGWLLILLYLLAGVLLIRRARRHAAIGGNSRLLIGETQAIQLLGPTPFFLRHRTLAGLEIPFGSVLRRLDTRRRQANLWEFRLHSGPYISFTVAKTTTLLLRCTDEEARALAHELRLRIARALEQDTQT